MKLTNKLSSEKNPHHTAVGKSGKGLLLMRDFFSPVLLKLGLEAHGILLGQPKPTDLFFWTNWEDTNPFWLCCVTTNSRLDMTNLRKAPKGPELC